MKRTAFALLVAATWPVAAAAQDRVFAAGEPYFGEQAIRHAVDMVLAINPTRVQSARDTHADSEAEINQSWAALVKSVRVGQKLAVTLRDSTTANGTLQAVDMRSIEIAQPGGLRVIDAADVVRVRDAGTRTRHVVYGILFGAVAGGIGAVVVDQRSSHPSSRVEAAILGAVFIGLPAGAIVGAALPIGPPLYDAPNVSGKTH